MTCLALSHRSHLAHVNWLGTWVVTKKCSLPYNHTFWHMRLKLEKTHF